MCLYNEKRGQEKERLRKRGDKRSKQVPEEMGRAGVLDLVDFKLSPEAPL